MTLPTAEEFLENLYRMRRECLSGIAAAEGRNDLKEARQLQKSLTKVNSMIGKAGGSPQA